MNAQEFLPKMDKYFNKSISTDKKWNKGKQEMYEYQASLIQNYIQTQRQVTLLTTSYQSYDPQFE